MSKFAFMVYVDTDRESGLIASRDEQSEQIINELEAIDGFQISGIGARADSEYSVSSVDIWEMSKKDEKEAHELYEVEVKKVAPSDRSLRNEIALANAEAEKYRKLYETQKDIMEQLLASPEFKETRVFQEDRKGGVKVRTYMKDGRYDPVHFLMSEDGDDHITVRRDEDGSLEIRYNAMGQQMVVVPKSGNEIAIRVLCRGL